MQIDEMNKYNRSFLLSIIVPCYNEEKTLVQSIERLIKIRDNHLNLDIIIIDDCSNDNSFIIANELARKYEEVRAVRHDINQGKGAAIRTGFNYSKGEYIGIQDADLEYNPMELKKLIIPLIEGYADVVFGSRYLSNYHHRVLYFWHSYMNKTLTFLSNMFTDLNITDMETCYKVFKRDILLKINIQENRFGFEPEIVAKVAQMRVRVYEMGISYSGRTYAEGKKINWKDGLRALYCIFHYNAPNAPIPIQLLIYVFIGGFSAIINILLFFISFKYTENVITSASFAYITAASMNYWLCVKLLFRHLSRWKSVGELAMYIIVVFFSGCIDVYFTKVMIAMNLQPVIAKSIASLSAFLVNFLGRKYFVFSGKTAGPWKDNYPNITID